MTEPTWWASWGQSAAAIAGFLTGVAGLGLGIYNARMNSEKHAWEKADREREVARKRWCDEKRAALGLMQGTALIQITAEEVAWAKWGDEQGLLRVRKRGDGEWFVFLR